MTYTIAIISTLAAWFVGLFADVNIDFGDLVLGRETIEKISRIMIIACGSSYHVGMVGKYNLEKLTRMPVENR